MDALTGAGTVNNSAGGSGGTKTLTIGNANGSGEFRRRPLKARYGGGIVLIKTGTGTQILGGTSTYTGATKVKLGTLLVNGSIAGAVTNASGAYFGGYGGTVGAR